jgi:asparagine synthase (glutamine-hydrolysing)
MCGIAGLVGKKLDDSCIDKLRISLKHRGPNNFGKFVNYDNTEIQLFHFRLSIIDLSNLANQPFTSDCGRYTLIFNGEIYNYISIKNILIEKGYKFKSNSDTEVLLYSYIAWGTSFLNLLEGMFAFSIWDNVEESLFIARDRFGEKPLYYFFDNNKFGFSSELRSLNIIREISPKLNIDSLSVYLKYQTVPFENTLINGIYCLKPGHYLVYKDKNIIIEPYWNLMDSIKQDVDKGPQSISDFKNILFSSVEKSLISDVPLGLFLSGGIDSSVLTVIAKKYLQNNISTFTVCFDDKLYKDKEFASYVSKLYNTNHHEIFFNPKQIEENVFDALNDIDHPTADGINTWIISKSVKNAGLTVAISGVGSDEIFGGYNTFKRMRIFKMVNKFYPKLISKYSKTSNKYLDFLNSDSNSTAYSYNRTFFTNNWINTLLPNNQLIIDPYVRIGIEFEKLHHSSFNFTSYMELSCYMTNVLLRDADQMSMAHSLEIRSPFLNHKVLESFQGLSKSDKYNYNTPKSILHNIFKDDFSKEFWNRPKQGFIMPWKSWLTNEIKPLSDKIYDKAIEQNIFNKQGLYELKKSFENNKISWSRYWLILSLTNWIDKNNIQS